jgi:hypothetical protein
VSDKVFPPRGGESMSEEDRERLPGNEEEQDSKLTRAISLAPLFTLILQILELILKICGVIK